MDKLILFIMEKFGKFFIFFGIILLLTSFVSRFAKASESDNYTLTTGTVTKVQMTKERSTSRRAGYSYVYRYNIWIDYKADGAWLTDTLFLSNNIDEMEVGEEVQVMYNNELSSKSYLAKKDWLTGKYLPAEPGYDLLAVIGIAFGLVGIYLNRKIKQVFGTE